MSFSPLPKAARPETLGQSRTWDCRANEAEAAGLCRRCAGQWAWGLQIGFARAYPPCSRCQEIVDQWPYTEKPNNWKGRPVGGLNKWASK